MRRDRFGAAGLRGLARAATIALLLALAAATAGCAGSADAGPPRVAAGTPCETCGMEVRDLRYACAARAGGRAHVYDSIECAMRGVAGEEGASVWLADYPTSGLHAADSLWVVRAEIPSPMGGGYAAFLDRGEADRVSAARGGLTGRLREFMARAREARP